MREIQGLVEQMSEEERRRYLVESLFLNSVTYENEMLDAYMRRLTGERRRAGADAPAGRTGMTPRLLALLAFAAAPGRRPRGRARGLDRSPAAAAHRGRARRRSTSATRLARTRSLQQGVRDPQHRDARTS